MPRAMPPMETTAIISERRNDTVNKPSADILAFEDDARMTLCKNGICPSEAAGRDRLANLLGAVGQAGFLGLVQRDGQQGIDAIAIDDAGDAQTDIVDAVIILDSRADRPDAIFILQQRFEDSGDGQADGVIGCAFAGDDLVGGGFYVLENL